MSHPFETGDGKVTLWDAGHFGGTMYRELAEGAARQLGVPTGLSPTPRGSEEVDPVAFGHFVQTLYDACSQAGSAMARGLPRSVLLTSIVILEAAGGSVAREPGELDDELVAGHAQYLSRMEPPHRPAPWRPLRERTAVAAGSPGAREEVRSGSVTVRPGVTLVHDDLGPSDGVPVLLVHGHPFDRSMWRPQAEALVAAGYRVILPDLRGYGASGVPERTGWSDFAEDLAGLLQRAGVPRAVVVGLSMGGQIAMEFHRLHPHRTAALVLADTSPVAETEEGRAGRNALADRLLAEGMDGYAAEVLDRMILPRHVTGLPEVAAQVTGMMRATAPAGAAAALRARAERPDYRASLGDARVPVLLLVGAGDTYTPVAEAEAMHRLIDDSVLAVVPDAAHLPHLEQPQRFNAELLAFLGSRREALRPPHPLLPLLWDAAEGRFPPADGAVTVLPRPASGPECSLAFTGHAVVATALPADRVREWRPDGFGGSLAPDFLRALAGPAGTVGTIDAVLVARGAGGPARLAPLPHMAEHPRVRHARALRQRVAVFGDERGLVTLAEGLAGRTELSVELAPGGEHGTGRGRALLADALTLVPVREPVFAAVSPGNARSLRAFLAAGFAPVGSESLFRPARAGG
jgi:pimeloyl-ACP methyl ester carboxylesterase